MAGLAFAGLTVGDLGIMGDEAGSGCMGATKALASLVIGVTADWVKGCGGRRIVMGWQMFNGRPTAPGRARHL
ncbi:hypothetical protein MPPM_4769 [Methylorubrum populi]|uniref:Uncharacterized protein n=1 Tax=Methylorubrum populi TaxID=223967 RepID=A0A160PJY8_9HYPH|nr:hypothetical protein MPPM_4769 [Methylorubrum populi]